MKTHPLKNLYWPLLVAITWLCCIGWIIINIGITGIAWGLCVSTLLTLAMVGTFFWLGRWSTHSRPLLLSAFLWGGSVATLCSLGSQEGLQALVDLSVGVEFGKWFRPLVITPVTEELFKGVFLIWLLVYRREQISGLLDGIVYGGIIGTGFAFTEQTLYFGKMIITYLNSAPDDTAALLKLTMGFALRGLMVPFMHSFFVAFIGLGVALASQRRPGISRSLLAVLGFFVPIVLHGIWDWAGLASDDRFLIFKIYASVMLPLFVALSGYAWVLRRRQARAIALGLVAN